jgi:hypothetical protein
MWRKVAFGLLAIGALVSCRESNHESIDAHKLAEWEWVSITWNDLSFGVDTLSDSLYVFEHKWLTTGRDYPADTVLKEVVSLPRNLRDSIWLLTQRVVSAPPILQEEVTDNAGDYLRIKLSAGATSDYVVYHSQIGWPEDGDLLLLKGMTLDRVRR